jgi:hypothetical protein
VDTWEAAALIRGSQSPPPDPSTYDIDHMVALGETHDSDGHA